MEEVSKDLFYNFTHSYYPELKTFATSYLTLVTTILVFSITFAEKIILPQKSNSKYNSMIFFAWFAFLTSIILGGYALWRLFAAYNIANDWYSLYDSANPIKENKIRQFKTIYSIAYRFLNYSGIVFVIGIMFLVASGLVKLFKSEYVNTENINTEPVNAKNITEPIVAENKT